MVCVSYVGGLGSLPGSANQCSLGKSVSDPTKSQAPCHYALCCAVQLVTIVAVVMSLTEQIFGRSACFA